MCCRINVSTAGTAMDKKMGRMKLWLPWLLLLQLLTTAESKGSGDDPPSPGGAILPPLIYDNVPKNCWNFTYGNPKSRVFYSPGYPKDYPNNTECMQVLIAPKGYVVQLDFRDKFHIESPENSQDCDYDYLEIRDGPYGYSNLKGVYCGRTHPPLLTSTSRYLWIQFMSDATIEYSGFKAVYDFVRDPNVEGAVKDMSLNFTIIDDSVCRIEINTARFSDGFVSNDDISNVIRKKTDNFYTPLDCTWEFHVAPGNKVHLDFVEYKSSAGICGDSYLAVYDSSTSESHKGESICGGQPKPFKSRSNVVYLRMFAKNKLIEPTFKVLYSTFSYAPCKEDQFLCGVNVCFNNSLKCNDRLNCPDPDTLEETACMRATDEPSTAGIAVEYHAVILGCVGGALFTIVLVALIVTCHQRSRDRERKRRLHINELRNQLEMDALLNQSPQLPMGNNIGNHVGNRPNGRHSVKSDIEEREVGYHGNHSNHKTKTDIEATVLYDYPLAASTPGPSVSGAAAVHYPGYEGSLKRNHGNESSLKRNQGTKGKGILRTSKTEGDIHGSKSNPSIHNPSAPNTPKGKRTKKGTPKLDRSMSEDAAKRLSYHDNQENGVAQVSPERENHRHSQSFTVHDFNDPHDIIKGYETKCIGHDNDSDDIGISGIASASKPLSSTLPRSNSKPITPKAGTPKSNRATPSREESYKQKGNKPKPVNCPVAPELITRLPQVNNQNSKGKYNADPSNTIIPNSDYKPTSNLSNHTIGNSGRSAREKSPSPRPDIVLADHFTLASPKMGHNKPKPKPVAPPRSPEIRITRAPPTRYMDEQV
ncbi:unnamed protein product [Owenia fusiformis]|uniref:CUB domain-containing protein n=1 Tax=Owenia fusiformis TaxID=6347 RepID=A0A8S4NCF5_OWEFU|nr:unnamed protein product [Owenia fusiformis]